VYGGAQEAEKEDFLSDLGKIYCDQSFPLLIGGDFNLIRLAAGKNKNFRSNIWSDVFNQIINSYEFREINMSGGQFTWSNSKKSPTLEKLDRFLMCSKWEKLFPLRTVHKVSREISDHSPVIQDTMENCVKKRKYFIFDNRWLKDDNFLLRVHKVWSKQVSTYNSLELLQLKLKNLKSNLKGWGTNLRGQIIKNKKTLLQELDELDSLEENQVLSPDQHLRRGHLQHKLMDIYETEEDFWQQRLLLDAARC
jgi:hypothetical protein